MPPISPVSRGPNPDLGSDYDDRMDIDEMPAPTGSMVATSHPRTATETTDMERANGMNGTLSQAKALSERQEQSTEINNQARARHEDRVRRLGKLLDEIRTIPSILSEYNDLCQEEMKEGWSSGQVRQRFHLIEDYDSDTSARTMSVSKGQNNRTRPLRSENKDRSTHQPHLDRIEENDPDRMDRDDIRHEPLGRTSSHSLRAFVAQSPTEESPMSRILSASGTTSAAAAAVSSAPTSATQIDDRDMQRQLISPPTSVASPQATVADISQVHRPHQQNVGGSVSALETVRTRRPGSPLRFSTRGQRRGSPHGTMTRHVIPVSQSTHPITPQSEKSTICLECHKTFTMPSKLK